MNKITIYDVAREAGVSLATVSRVINGSSVVKQSTKEKVLKVIEKLDFKPNEVARGLATSKTTTIAIVFPQSLFSNIEDMISGIGDTGRHLDYNINMYTSDDIGDDNTIEDITERLVKSRADGVILFNNKYINSTIDNIKKYNIPLVVVGKKISDENIGSIYIDGKQAISSLIERCLEKGKQDIAYILPKQNLLNNEDIIAGIKDTYKKYNIELDENKIIHTASHYETNYPRLCEYFASNKHEIVICGNDKDGVAVINAAYENNIEVPAKMEVIGMLNSSYSSMSRPSLSTLNVPIYDMGALAIRLLTKLLNNEEIESKEVAVQHQFLKRDSTN